MELNNAQKRIYELAHDRKDQGFCIHDIMENLGMKQADASARVSELLSKGLITKMFVKYTCRISDRKHTFFGLKKSMEEVEEETKEKPKVEPKAKRKGGRRKGAGRPPARATLAKKGLKDRISSLKAENSDYRMAIDSFKKKNEQLEKRVEELKDTIAFQDKEMDKHGELAMKLRKKNEILKELLRDEMLGK